MVHTHQGGGDYEPAEVELPTLLSLVEMRGEVTTLLGGVDVSVDAFATPDTAEELAASVRVRGGRAVDPRFYVMDGLIVSEDFGTLLALTYYSHMETCRELFRSAGLPEELPGHIDTFYLPTFGTTHVGGLELIRDNAAYSPTFEAFAIFPRHILMDRPPLAMNLGVVCHEYSHAVFHSVVAGDSKVPAGTMAGWQESASRLIRSVDEGMADLFGALVTSDPSFIAPSLPEDMAEERDLSGSHELSPEMLEALEDTDLLLYDPYPLGSVLASALWKTAAAVGEQTLGEIAMRCIDEVRDVAGPDLVLEDVTQAFFSAMDAGGRPALCEALDEAALPPPAECEELP